MYFYIWWQPALCKIQILSKQKSLNQADEEDEDDKSE